MPQIFSTCNRSTNLIGPKLPRGPARTLIMPLQVDFLFLVNDFPTSDEGKGENRNLETFLLSVSGQKEYQY